MACYIYHVKDDTGRNLYGLTDGNSKKEIKQKLINTDLFFISARPFLKDTLYKKRVSFTALIMFTHRLTSLVEAGVPLLTAFTILWRQSEDRSIQLIVSSMKSRLEEGNKISTAMEDFPNIFPPLYLALIRVGEASGVLVPVLRKLSDYLDYKAATISRIKKAMLYPSIVIAFSIIVVVAMFAFVVPVFQNVLLRLNVDLPWLTILILNISKMIRSIWFILFIILLIAFLYFGYRLIRTNSQLAYLWDKNILKIPYFGKIILTVSLSQFIRSLSILLGTGVPILGSFDVARTTAGNQKIMRDIENIKKRVEVGTSLYDSFRKTPGFPIMLVEMIGVGESSGMVVPILEKVTKHFDEESDYYLNKFITYLEPAMLIVVGFIVIITLLAVYLPVINIWQGLMNR